MVISPNGIQKNTKGIEDYEDMKRFHNEFINANKKIAIKIVFESIISFPNYSG